ncbi:MAG TPA: TlpA disulfide reductase family protein, partial [Capsulimonadaceae bacterium]|nr:TlpA disulfide reductase family protein [Capsulimonadaceae bacterium]
SLNSLSADDIRTLTFFRGKSKKARNSTIFAENIELMRPAYARATETVHSKTTSGKSDKGLAELYISDGTNYWDYYDAQKKLYEKHPVSADGHGIRLYGCDLLNGFFEPDKSGYTGLTGGWDKIDIQYAGHMTWQGQTYQALRRRVSGTADNETLEGTMTVLIGQDGLVHRTIENMSFNTGDRMITDESLDNLAINPTLAKDDFSFTPPAGATEKAQFALDTSAPSPSQPLLADGATAPDFTANDRNGKPIHLSDYKGKVVVLDFWATWCGPCQMALPNTNNVAKKYPNAIFLAVNVWDTKSAFDSWLPQHKDFSALKFLIDPTEQQGKDIASTLYHVDGIPTQFVIDPAGKVVKSFVGYDPDTSGLQHAIQNAGKGG